MLTIYAKNMAGEMLSLFLSSGVRTETIRCRLYPDDPSSVRILSRTPKEIGMSDDALYALMEELQEMARGEEDKEEDKEEEEEDLETCTWQDGDVIEYLIELDELFVTLVPPMGGPYYACSDTDEQWPLYPITMLVEKGKGGDVRTVYCWCFLFSLRDGRYCAPSDFSMEPEGGGGDIYLALRPSCVWHPTIFEAIRSDNGIRTRYKEKMLRAIYRKWTKTLRAMSKRSMDERRLEVVYGTEYLEGERAMFKQHYYALRAMKHNVMGRDDK